MGWLYPGHPPSQGTSLCIGFSLKTCLGVNASASSHCWLLLPCCCPAYPSATASTCCGIPPAQGQGRAVSCFGSGPPAQPPCPACPRAGWDAGREGSGAGWPSWHQHWWDRCVRAPMLRCPAYISPCTSAGGAGSHPQKWTQCKGLRRRAHPGLWGGLALGTDTACDLRESLKDSESFLL